MATLKFTEGTPEAPTTPDNADQLLPNIIDGMSNSRPEAIYAIIPKSFTSYDDGFRSVTYRQLASCINGIAWQIREELGLRPGFPALAYLGPPDISYVCVILGAVKVGYTVLCASPRNTSADHAALFDKLKCNTLLTLAPPYSTAVDNVLAGIKSTPRIIHVPTIYELLSQTYPHYPYPKAFKDAINEPIFLAHTSGSTGTPKPITYTHGFVSAYIRWGQAKAPPGHVNMIWRVTSSRTLVALPLHASGALLGALFDYPFNQTVLVSPLAGVPLSTEVAIGPLKHVDVDAIILPPPFLEDVARSEELAQLVASKVSIVAFGGGDINHELGTSLASRTTLLDIVGSSETTAWPLIRPIDENSPADWQYIMPNPSSGIQFEQTTTPDLFETVVKRKSDGTRSQPCFAMFPDLDEFRTRDLWSKHPTKPGLWRWRSRIDDMINFKAGFLCNPMPAESFLLKSPAVKAAIIIGTGHFQPALLVEPADPQSSHEELLQILLPVLEQANEMLPCDVAIRETHVLFTRPDLPLLRAGKETVKRGPSLALYETEIKAIYDKYGDQPTVEGGNYLNAAPTR